MEQAQAFMSALTRASTYRIVDGQLQLRAAEGTVVATLAGQSQSLAGTSWRVTGYNNGKAGSGERAFWHEFDHGVLRRREGQRFGRLQCLQRDLRVRWAEAHHRAGRRHQEDVPSPGHMEQEQQFLKALETVATARFEGDRLELRSTAGALAVALTK